MKSGRRLKTRLRNNSARPSRATAENAVRTLIQWAGDDPRREGLLGTPARVVRAYEEWFAGYFEDPRAYLQRTFEEVAGYEKWCCCVTSVSNPTASTTWRRSSAVSILATSRANGLLAFQSSCG